MVDAEHASQPSEASGADDSSTQPAGAPAAPTETAPSATQHETGQQSPADAADSSGTRQAQRVDELPEWAQTEIRKARDEAKRHRQTAKEHSEQAGKVPDLESHVAELRNTVATRDSELGRIRAVLNTGKVTDPSHVLDMAERINGATQDDMDADAEKLAELFGFGAQQPQQQQRRADPTQGSGHQSLNGDPMETQMRRVLGI